MNNTSKVPQFSNSVLTIIGFDIKKIIGTKIEEKCDYLKHSRDEKDRKNLIIGINELHDTLNELDKFLQVLEDDQMQTNGMHN